MKLFTITLTCALATAVAASPLSARQEASTRDSLYKGKAPNISQDEPPY
jgi:hypothetical protein